MRNQEIADMLYDLADLLEIRGEDRFRVGAYRRAAQNIESLTEDVELIWKQGHLEDIPGVGEGIAKKIDEKLRTGNLRVLEDVKKEIPPGLTQVARVPGIGPKTALKLFKQLNITDLETLKEKAESGAIQKIPGLGPKSEENILKGIQRVEKRLTRMLLSTVLPTVDEIVKQLSKTKDIYKVSPAGSVRRMKETIGDIDIQASTSDPEKLIGEFTKFEIVDRVTLQGPTKVSVLTKTGLQVDLRVVKPEEFGAALQYFTGSKAHNIKLRDIAIKKGFKLNEYGLFEVKTDKRVAGETEESIYETLGMRMIPPEMREDRGEIEAAMAGKLPRVIEYDEVKADCHIHSNWSDGSATIEEMAMGAKRRGYDFMVLTDHSKGLGIARGLSEERIKEQRKIIEELNEKKLNGFTILQGSEVNIRGDGSLDYTNKELALFDVVSASIHGGFNQPEEKITNRIISAMKNPYVYSINHPTGRLIGKREAYGINLEKVLEAARDTGTCLEIDGQADRLDLNDVWARRAKETGCRIVIDSDAHSVAQLEYMRYGIAVARRAWLETKDVVNALPMGKYLSTIKKGPR
jgi:DNA polymerase (family 10)